MVVESERHGAPVRAYHHRVAISARHPDGRKPHERLHQLCLLAAVRCERRRSKWGKREGGRGGEIYRYNKESGEIRREGGREGEPARDKERKTERDKKKTRDRNTRRNIGE